MLEATTPNLKHTNKVVVTLEICAESVDNQNDGVILVIQEQRGGQVSNLQCQAGNYGNKLQAVLPACNAPSTCTASKTNNWERVADSTPCSKMEPDLFSDQIGLAASLQRFHVGPAGVLTQHFDVDQSHKKFFQPSLVHLRIFQPRLENLDFLADEQVLFCFGLALSDSPDQGVEFSTPCRAFLAH